MHHWQIPKFSTLVGETSADEAKQSTSEVTVPHKVATGDKLARGDQSRESLWKSSVDHEHGQADATRGKAAAHDTSLVPSQVANGGSQQSPLAQSRRVIQFASYRAAQQTGIGLGSAEVRNMDEFIVANGVVGYDETHLAQLSARVPGIVWSVEKQVGETVERSDVLAVIDAADVGRSKAEFLKSVVQYDLKSRNLERLLSIRNSVPESRLRQAKAEWREARFDRFNAQQALANLGLPVDLSQTEGLSDDQLARHVQFLGLPPSITKSLEAAKASANLLPLVAPFEAVVVRREIVTGEMVEPSKPQFVLADVRTMWIHLNVRAEDVLQLQPGQKVEFSLDGVPGEIPATLQWIGTEVEPKTRTVRARAEALNPVLSGAAQGVGQRLLRANAYGTGRIRIRQHHQSVVVPTQAVHWQWDDSCHIVFVPRQGGRSFAVRKVEVGISRDGFVEVLAGLKPGENVVVEGSRILAAELSERTHESAVAADAATSGTESSVVGQ